MKRNKIIVYTDLLDCVSLLDNEQLGQIFKALLQWSESKEIEIEDSEASIAFKIIIGRFAKQIKS